MLSVNGSVEVRCTLEEAWDLFSRFGDVARLIPTMREVQVDGDQVHATVATTLGALPITSRVALEVTGRKELEYLEAEGVSYLGETIHEQVKKIRDVAKDSAGRFSMRLDLKPSATEGCIVISYHAEVEAKGRLKRIYNAILKTKVPGMMEEFATNLREALEQPAVDGPPAAARPPAAGAARAAGPTKTAAAAHPGPAPAQTPSAPAGPGAVLPNMAERITELFAWLRSLLEWLRGTP